MREKSNKNLIFIYIKHDMEVENDAKMNSNQYTVTDLAKSWRIH